MKTDQAGDGLGMAPRVKEPESALVPGQAAPRPPGGPQPAAEAISGKEWLDLLGSMPDTSIGPVALQQPAAWAYDFDPATGNSRATYVGVVSMPASGLAPLASPAFTGTPTAPTAAPGTNTNQIATTAFVQAANIELAGRLTLTSGTPVMTADVSNATTIFFTPYLGNHTLLNVGGNGQIGVSFAEVSLGLNATAHVINTVYDLFLYSNAGTIQLVSGPAWSSGTARAAGGAINLQGGVYCNTGSMAAIATGNTPVTVPAGQGLYLGSFRIGSVAGQTAMIMNPAAASGGAQCFLFLWNYFNRVNIEAQCRDNGATYTYTPNTFRQARASAANQINFVSGFAEDSISAKYCGAVSTAAAAGATGQIGIGLDATNTTINLQSSFVASQSAAVLSTQLCDTQIIPPQIGFHFVAAIEVSDNVNANTFDALSRNNLQVQLRM